jgi:hypothetical protein
MKLKDLKDGKKFKLSKRKNAVIYQLIKKVTNHRKAVYTSTKSHLSFTRDWTILVHPIS